MKPATLPQVRKEIAATLAEIQRTKTAGLPEETSAASLSTALDEIAELWTRFVANAAAMLASGEPITRHRLVSVIAPSPEQLAALALGAAISSRKPEVIAEITAEAKMIGVDCLRLEPEERTARLRELRRKLYLAELAEEQIIAATGDPRRHAMNAAAVLGIPESVAGEFGLMTEVE